MIIFSLLLTLLLLPIDVNLTDKYEQAKLPIKIPLQLSMLGSLLLGIFLKVKK